MNINLSTLENTFRAITLLDPHNLLVKEAGHRKKLGLRELK